MQTIEIERLRVKTGDLVLDIGCGEGRHTIAAQYHFPQAMCIGLDLSEKELQKARSQHKNFFNGAQTKNLYLRATAFNLPFADASIDHVICSEVLEHIHDYDAVLNEIQRVLKPAGNFALSVPRAWPEKLCWRLSRAYHEVEGGHVHIFKRKALRSNVLSRPFNMVHEHGAHALHVPYWWLRCLFWREAKQVAVVNWYHRFLVWDLMKKPTLTRCLEKLLNPLMGKSIVMYFQRNDA